MQSDPQQKWYRWGETFNTIPKQYSGGVQAFASQPPDPQW